jgi:hypothetical protein
VAAALLAFSRPVVGATRGLAETSRSLAGQEAMWIDRELGEGESAALVITPHPDVYTSSAALLQTEFWNRRVEDVGLLGGSEICPLPADVLTVDPATGQIARPTAAGPVPVDESHVVVQRGTAVFGELVAEGGTVLSIPLALYRVIPPLRLETATDGIHADGWMGSDASYTRYAVPDEGGSVDIGLSRAAWTGPDVPGRVRIRIGRLVPDADGVPRLVPRETVRWTIHSGDQRVFRLAAPSPPFRVEVHVEPTFSPSEFGQPDPRQLGAQVTFTYVPPP